MIKTNSQPKTYVAGHQGMVGSAIVRLLRAKNRDDIVTRDRGELDLTNQAAVNTFFESEKPSEVYLAAGKVGGIFANNTYPSDFIYQNLMIATNVIDAAFKNGVTKLLFLGSSCIYPKLAIQPMPEDALLTGALEPTNEPYAIAKIAGIKLCESYNRQFGESHGVDYRSLMPTNLYGPGDNYHPENSHVIPALIRRFHEAKINNLPAVNIWGTGNARREFLYVDDLALACEHLMNVEKTLYDQYTSPTLSHVNVGSGEDISISTLAIKIKETTGYQGKVVYDRGKPDGAPRKLLDSKHIYSLGWKVKTSLDDGLQKTYQEFKKRWANKTHSL